MKRRILIEIETDEAGEICDRGCGFDGDKCYLKAPYGDWREYIIDEHKITKYKRTDYCKECEKRAKDLAEKEG